MAQNKMSWKNKILCPSITKCPQEMAQHDFRSFDASDKNHFITSIGLVYQGLMGMIHGANKMSWKNEILCPSINKCPQEMAKHDFRSFGASDKSHFDHLYWACIGWANGVIDCAK